MDNAEKVITIITPTTGKDTLFKLIESIECQCVPWVHIILWDDKREGKFLYPDTETLSVKNPQDLNSISEKGIRYNVVIPGSIIRGTAYGSALRSVGLMLANTPYVTFADDDVWFENGHFDILLQVIKNKEWAYCRRKIWTEEGECLGIDNFESVGNSPSKAVPYEMVDNNCMIFKRRFGSSGAVLYRETQDYNDDRMFYAFLKQYAGEPETIELANVNQVCPKRLEEMFRQYCTK